MVFRRRLLLLFHRVSRNVLPAHAPQRAEAALLRTQNALKRVLGTQTPHSFGDCRGVCKNIRDTLFHRGRWLSTFEHAREAVTVEDAHTPTFEFDQALLRKAAQRASGDLTNGAGAFGQFLLGHFGGACRRFA